MEYFIVNKIEFIDSEVVFTPIGYLINQDDCVDINVKHDSTLGAWIESNRPELETGVVLVSTFFDTTPIVYIARTTATNVYGLIEITNISEMV
tara:strand:+ start:122 stop:400 length:279 start_codon:yes stop_codon:yes gene_type:complete